VGGLGGGLGGGGVSGPVNTWVPDAQEVMGHVTLMNGDQSCHTQNGVESCHTYEWG